MFKLLILHLSLILSINLNLFAGVVEEDMYYSKIKPLFDQRCVACHSCYESPCQLKLTSYQGFMRGAHGSDIYADRFKDKLPKHRMNKDAKTTQEWRDKGFWKITEQDEKEIGLSAQEKLDRSLLWKFVKVGADNNKKDEGFRINERRDAKTCVKSTDEFNKLLTKSSKDMYVRSSLARKGLKEKVYGFSPRVTRRVGVNKAKGLGMPFGLPKLEETQMDLLKSWVIAGSKGPSVPAKIVFDTVKNIQKVKTFEDFLNNDSYKHKWTAKYLYEHLYLTHIYFEDGEKEFFELVRSKTKTGQIKEIVTDLPFNHPGVDRVYYRLQKITSTIVLKTHIIFKTSDAYLERLKNLFIDSDWGENVKNVNYNTSNPFVNFKYIPAKSRYQFMLDHAYMLAGLFTTGTACNGVYATYAVRDHFWVFFVDPEADVSLNTPNYFDDFGPLLQMPHDDANSHLLYRAYKNNVINYEVKHAQKLKEFRPTGLKMTDIWQGDQTNPSALLTIYRHDARTSVHYGAVGGRPNTVWVVDYPVFERIYYNLVAGFDVYATLKHKFQTRVYMEQLRRESEDMFLSFLPKTYRANLRKSWYKKDLSDFFDLFSTAHKKDFYLKDIAYSNDELIDRKYERGFVDLIRSKYFNKKTDSVKDKMNDINFKAFYKERAKNKELKLSTIEYQLASIAYEKSPYNKFFKDVSYLRISDELGKSRFFTLVHNRSHKSMNVVFDEEETFDPKNDTIDIVENLAIPHSNIFFDVKLKDIPKFVKTIKKIETTGHYKKFELQYGISRTSSKFWGFYDDLNTHFSSLYPIDSGILDLNLYGLDQASK